MRRRGVCNWHQRGIASYDACARGRGGAGRGGGVPERAAVPPRCSVVLSRRPHPSWARTHGGSPAATRRCAPAAPSGTRGGSRPAGPAPPARGRRVGGACGRRVAWRRSGWTSLHSRVGGGRGGRTMASTPSSSTVCSSTVCARPSAALHICCVTVSSASLR